MDVGTRNDWQLDHVFARGVYAVGRGVVKALCLPGTCVELEVVGAVVTGIGALIGVGLVGGAGIGLAYVVPIAVGMRWFPDRKGMITGAAVAGFGFGAFGWIKMAGSWGELIDTIGLDGTFVAYGLVFAAMVVGSSALMRMPPEGWVPEGFVPPVAAGAGGEDVSAVGADPAADARQLEALGVSRAMVPAFFFAGPGGLDRLAEFGEKVVAPLAS